MATNKLAERLSSFSLLMPVVGGNPINVSSGQPLLYGDGTHYLAGVATEAENSALPVYDSNTGYLTVDFEGVYALSVVAETLGSVSAGAAINTGDAIYASGGTYDKVSGITYGFTLCKDTGGAFFGLAMQPLAAGSTATIGVLLKNAA
jgi:hypothetical protein